jgi:hypothetical protein
MDKPLNAFHQKLQCFPELLHAQLKHLNLLV